MISVILATKNRASKLCKCLQSLQEAGLPEVGGELLVVNNGSTDETAGVLEDFARSYPGQMRIVNEAVAGVSAARNAGIAQAVYGILCFFDDDIYPQPGYFSTLAGRLNDPFDLCCGRVLLFDPTAARTSINESQRPLDFTPRMLLRPGLVHGCHLIVRRRVIEKIGGFDVLLGAGSTVPAGEDHDFASRALNAGFRAKYLPELCIYHDHGRIDNSSEMIRIEQNYSLGRGGAYLKRMLEGDLRYLGWWIGTLRPSALGRFADEFRGAKLYWAARETSALVDDAADSSHAIARAAGRK